MESVLEVEKIPALSSERETFEYFWVKKDFALVGNGWMYSAAGFTAHCSCEARIKAARCKFSGARGRFRL